jgi:hypothetical protein
VPIKKEKFIFLRKKKKSITNLSLMETKNYPIGSWKKKKVIIWRRIVIKEKIWCYN